VRSSYTLAAAALVFSAGLAGCNTQTSAADGATEQVCQAMSQVNDSLASLGSAQDAGQAQAAFTTMSENLQTAKSEASGLAQAILTNLSASTGTAAAKVADLAPDAALPEGFTGTVNSVKKNVDDVYGKLKCE